jgi:hypothetical protein
MRRGTMLGWVAVIAALATRLPLLAATHHLPVSNDDAIPLLMARHVLRGELATILWNQPYNGALDAYLLAPGLVVASPHAVFRAYEALCALFLVGAVGLFARELGGSGAGFAAAALAALGTPYMGLMAATGPPPNFLVPLLICIPLLVGLRRLPAGERTAGPRAHPVPAALAGVVSGLAIWDSALAVPSLLGIGLGLLLAGLRPSASGLATYLAGLAAGASPLLVARAVRASAASTVTAVRPRWLWVDGLRDLAHAAGGLLGLQVPLVVDGPERAALPAPLLLLLAAGLVCTVVLGAGSRRALPLLGWAGFLGAAFAYSRRTGAHDVRYLYGLTVPVLTLAGAGLVQLARRHLAVAAAGALALIVPWLSGHRTLVHAWRDPGHAARVWQVPTLDPVLDTLRRAHVQSAYASLQFAGRLDLESGGRLRASQAWNERIPGDPLRFRDEVDLDPRAAWALSSHLSRGMPRAAGFRELLQGMGGSWREDLPGEFVVFRRFVPPYDEARPVPAAALTVSTLDGTSLPEAVLDRDVTTAWTSPAGIARGSGLVVRIEPPRALSALVLAVDLERSPLAVPWLCEVEGTPVARGPARHGLQWVNGAPRAAKQALLAISFAEPRRAGLVRLLFQDSGPPLTVAEVFAYGPEEAQVADAGAEAAEAALTHARAGEWDHAVRAYAEAGRLSPHRASHHAALARARWRAQRRAWLDVESLDDGGPALVAPAPERPR